MNTQRYPTPDVVKSGSPNAEPPVEAQAEPGPIRSRITETTIPTDLYGCYGVGGVTITVTDANKVSHELKSNSAGNFWLAAADAPEFKMPFTVKIRHNGREGQMYSPQTIGSCNNCHSASGKDPSGQFQSPGRICVDPDEGNCM